MNMDCEICYIDNNNIQRLECYHQMCTKCFCRMIEHHHIFCPFCRQKISIDYMINNYTGKYQFIITDEKIEIVNHANTTFWKSTIKTLYTITVTVLMHLACDYL
ncbi:MAG: hypothetical protein Dasosvirus5_14 [Dasosvirus sp.]|uniref:RING-type domain-containing protein n=1 Tax=Dasosvirus sp. TaxID=2487764 RepID=A0A3G4ZRN7_9VIRU|nr:MAG: hypothetical protein Dasosvirus5_14 [Dasosvirus sp.]